MKNAHVGISHHSMSQYMPHEKGIHVSPDYFNEALRILDNDVTIIPQREHLKALWGLVVGLSRRLTKTRVERRNHRSVAISDNRRRHKNRKSRKVVKWHGSFATRPPFPAAGLG